MNSFQRLKKSYEASLRAQNLPQDRDSRLSSRSQRGFKSHKTNVDIEKNPYSLVCKPQSKKVKQPVRVEPKRKLKPQILSSLRLRPKNLTSIENIESPKSISVNQKPTQVKFSFKSLPKSRSNSKKQKPRNLSIKTNSTKSKGGKPVFKGHSQKKVQNSQRRKLTMPKVKSSLDKVLVSTQSTKPKRKRNKKRLVSDERVFKEVTINNNASKALEPLTSKQARRLEKIFLIERARRNFGQVTSESPRERR